MKWLSKILSRVARRPLVVVTGLMLVLAPASLHAQCPGCVTFNDGVKWGNVSFSSLDEASGLAVSTRNPGVIWSHNDDGNVSDPNKEIRLFAFRTNGAGVARYTINVTNLIDIEDMAIGPGPSAGVQYLYVGDIGGDTGVRNEVRIIRVAEPLLPPSTPGSPPSLNFTGVEVFTLKYPPAYAFDAEGLLVDPLNGDLYIFTKNNSFTFAYRFNLNTAPAGSTNLLEEILIMSFPEVSGAAISQDGSQIALRNEFAAQIWVRCPGETISNALTRTGQNIPLMSLAAEPNGEAIAFLPNGRGYITTTDSPPGGNKIEGPPIHLFSAACLPTVITQQPQSTTNVVGANTMFFATATGTNLQYQWRFNGGDLAGENTNLLWLTSLQTNQAGLYTLRVLGNGGAATSNPARLGVRVVPPSINSQPPTLIYAPTGSIVRIPVGVAGTAPFHFNWALGRTLFNQNSNVLTLLNVTNRSSGKYRVTVTNSAGKAVSGFANLRVLLPPTILTPPLARTNRVNTPASFRVRVKGNAPLRYQWYFNDVPIAGATRSSLSLRRVQTTNSGLYSVRVTNFVGTATSADAQLTVP